MTVLPKVGFAILPVLKLGLVDQKLVENAPLIENTPLLPDAVEFAYQPYLLLQLAETK